MAAPQTSLAIHFWIGKDGALEFVDNAKKRTRDQIEGVEMFREQIGETVYLTELANANSDYAAMASDFSFLPPLTI